MTIENDGEVGQFVYGGLTTGDGQAEGNTVKITKGTVIGTPQQGTGGSVWGGRSVDGAVRNNTVEISGRRLTADPPADPPVTPPGAPHGTYIHYYVYGGHATGDGAVENNTVTVTGGTVHSAIFGGHSNNGVVKNNTVKISGAAAETSVREVYGGKATGNGAAEGNKVEIDSAGVKVADGSVVGGDTANGDAKGNTVTFTKNAAGSKVKSVYGGRVGGTASPDKGHGSATENTVILHAGTIDGSFGTGIYGGFAQKDSATGNKVILEKDVVVNDAKVYGGLSEENGDASHNEVTLRGDNVKAKFFEVYGGKTSGGHADGNKVAFHGGKVRTALVGGEGNSGASSNEVTIENGDFSAATDWIIGGKSGRGSTDKNTVTIHKVVHDTLAVAVTGGKGGASASKNTVTLGKMTTSATAKVTGGSAGEANGNTVNLTNVEAGAAVTGGDAIGGSANENKVNMTGGKVTAGDLIGGKTTADADGKAGDANENVLTLTKVRELQAVTGGASAKGTASKNIVTIDGTDEALVRTEVKGDILGGHAADGAANHNEVKLRNVKDAKDVVGGSVLGKGSASGNTVEVSSEAGDLALTAVTGGTTTDGSAENNTVKLTNLKTGATVMGGHAAKVTVERADVTKNTVEIAGGKFSAVTGGATNGGDATENTVTLTKGVDVQNNVLGGEAATGKAADNKVTVTGGKIGSSVVAGLTGTGDASGNEVTLRQVEVDGVPAPGNPAGVAGGVVRTSGAASSNTVTIEGNETGTKRIVKGDVAGGMTASGDASGNVVSLKDIEVRHAVYGGQGTGKTSDNTVRLNGVTVGGTVYGGTGAAESLNNTLEIYGKASTIGDFSGVQNLHFYVDSDRVNDQTALLTLTSSGAKDIKGLGLGVKFSGDAKILHTGDQMTLLKASGALTTDDTIENKFTGSHGSSLHYEFDIAKAATDDKTLVATVTAAGMTEETKSYVETRAALADMVNHAGDVVAGESLSAAKKAAAAAVANADMDRYQVWAGINANTMRAESGSHVDTKGWNFGLGWARQDGGAAKKVLFSPFVEYGRGNYDSYLDNGTHGSGSMSYFGLGVLARMESAKGLWYEGSVRGGRSTSDYSGNGVSYDGDNTYYGAHLGIGRDIKMKDSDTVTPYLRYFYSHQNSMRATLTSGETYDFGAVDSHRIRLGVKYAHAVSEANEFYAGLAYEYEFKGEATATFQGFDAPTPSLKGASGMLELGYRFTPQGQPLTYDLHLTGWQGVRRGFSGGAQVTWAF